MLADLFGIIVKAGADDPEPIRRQGSAVQGPVRYCWYFSYSLFDICCIVPSGHLGKLESVYLFVCLLICTVDTIA